MDFKTEMDMEKRKFQSQLINDELEKVEIATMLCNTLNIEQMRRIQYLVKRKSKIIV